MIKRIPRPSFLVEQNNTLIIKNILKICGNLKKVVPLYRNGRKVR